MKPENPRVLIVHQTTLGLRHDALVLARALRKARPGLETYVLEVSWRTNFDYGRPLDVPESLSALAPFDTIFFLEHLFANDPLFLPSFAARRVYVPNVEWILPPDERSLARFEIDGVLYKNAFTRGVFEQLEGAGRIPIREITGWSSLDIAKDYDAAADLRDTTSFLHVRGISVQKQTAIVMQTWLENPDFPPIRIVATMRDGFSVPVPLRAAGNIELQLGCLETHELRALQRSHAIHIAPSEVEGFGHSLNEARACASILITTGGEPMSDFVAPGKSGFLVPAQPHESEEYHRSTGFRITSEDLAATVRRALEMTPAECRAMGTAAREQFLRDKVAFESAIARIFGPGGPLQPGG